jgi:hypothetical protein
MATIKEFLGICYQRFTSEAGVGASLGRAVSGRLLPNRCVDPTLGYFNGIARNQISIPNKISAPRSENSVCNG